MVSKQVVEFLKTIFVPRGNPPGCRVRRSTTQTISTSETENLIWNVEIEDTDNCWSSGNADKMYAKTAGYYNTGASILIAPCSTGRVRLIIRHSVDGIVGYNSLGAPSNESGEALCVSTGMLHMDVDEYIYIEVNQSSGGDKSITAATSTTSAYNCGWLAWVGPG